MLSAGKTPTTPSFRSVPFRSVRLSVFGVIDEEEDKILDYLDGAVSFISNSKLVLCSWSEFLIIDGDVCRRLACYSTACVEFERSNFCSTTTFPTSLLVKARLPLTNQSLIDKSFIAHWKLGVHSQCDARNVIQTTIRDSEILLARMELSDKTTDQSTRSTLTRTVT